jgi:hypothetical protein
MSGLRHASSEDPGGEHGQLYLSRVPVAGTKVTGR